MFWMIGAILGAVWGSFFLVFVSRFLRNQTPFEPFRSYCSHCGRQLSWWQNIPIISYIILRGRCFFCQNTISVEHFVFEVIWSFIGGWLFYRYELSWTTLWLWIWVSALIAVSYIDFYTFLIPDFILMWAGILGMLLSLFFEGYVSFAFRLLGALVGYLFLYLLNQLYRLIRNMDGMGGGDFKLMALIGFQVGLTGIWGVLILASVFGAIYGLWSVRCRKSQLQQAIPFGPFLSFSGIILQLGFSPILSLFDSF